MAEEHEAVKALEELGLSNYEAKCFVALCHVPQGTAKEISQISEVPRSRVYDTVNRLHERGLVDIQQSDPREYKAVPKEAAFERLRRDYDATIESANEALENLQPVQSKDDQGVWATTSSEHVVDRIVTLLDDAKHSVHLLIGDDTTLDDRTIERLNAASDRGVRITVEVPTEAMQERIREKVSDETVVVATDLQELEKVVEKWPGQLLMVDESAILASGVEESELPGVTKESAMWTHGRDHGFAAWIRELLDDRLAAIESE